MLILSSVSEYNALRSVETLHPLISVVDFEKHPIKFPEAKVRMRMDFYFIALKDVVCGDIRYGRTNYDYQEGTLVFVGPKQEVEIYRRMDMPSPRGKALLFHPDLIRGTSLAARMDDFKFFSYSTREALHLSDRERSIVIDCFSNIEAELRHDIDRHTRMLIASHIELLLNYCTRFYDRQFITRSHQHHDIVSRFEQLLKDYLRSGEARHTGIPTVAYFAGKLHLSANYFGDLIKKETGMSPQLHIREMMMEVAKERICTPGKSLAEVAIELGFNHTQHFSRFFKQYAGTSPSAYRAGLN